MSRSSRGSKGLSSDDAVVPLLDPTEDDDMLLDKSGDEKEQEEGKAKGNALVIAFLAMVVVGLGNKIFQVLMLDTMENYPLFANLLSTFIYIPASFAYIFPMIKYGSLITKEAQEIPKYKWAIMGGLDSTAGIMQTLSIAYITSGALVILLPQAAIPSSMVITKIFLKRSYKTFQYVFATIVVVGIVVVLIPQFTSSSSNSGGHNSTVWCIVLVLSCIPMCLSSVYKEKALGDAEIDAVYMNGWVALFQLCIAIPLLIPSAVASNLAIEDIPKNLLHGAYCYGGVNSLSSDDCTYAPLYFSTYLAFNLCYNVLILLIIKYGSSNILWLAMTVMVPLANAFFAIPGVPRHKAFSALYIIGLILIMTGLVGYRFWSTIKDKWLARNKPPVSEAYDGFDAESETAGESPMGTPVRGTNLHVHRSKKQKSLA